MSKSAKGGSSGKGGSLIAGVVLGMVMGLAAAGGVAWYIIKKNPASFENKEHHETPKPEPENITATPKTTTPPAAASSPAAEAGAAKQHFEFYKVLTDKSDGATPKGSERSAAKEPHAATAKPTQPAATTKEIFYVQAGSFPNEDEAEKLKAKLALLGLEASIQTAVIPDRGTYHRVRLGPFNNSNDVNKVMASLKQNGVANATTIKVQ